MSIKTVLEEKLYLPLKAAWAAKNGLSPLEVRKYTQDLLHNIDNLPPLRNETAVILGSTRATAFIVDAALKDGHRQFLLIGGKSIAQEHPSFTSYVEQKLTANEQAIADENPVQTEAEYAERLLRAAGVPAENIQRLSADNSTNTGANMRMLTAAGFAKHESIEMYALAGSALRAFMTARKEFGHKPVLCVHNAYPRGVNAANWSSERVACAHMAGEAAKSIGDNPLYVRLGYACSLNLEDEAIDIHRHHRHSAKLSPFTPA